MALIHLYGEILARRVDAGKITADERRRLMLEAVDMSNEDLGELISGDGSTDSKPCIRCGERISDPSEPPWHPEACKHCVDDE